jgi:Phage integrase family
MPGFHRGRPPRNKGLQYPADPPTVEEIVAVMRCAGDGAHGLRTRALIVLLWRAGLRISEALGLAESDLDVSRGSVLVRRGKGGKRREVGMDLGPGSTSTRGWTYASGCVLAHWCALSTEPPKADHGHRPPPAPPCENSPLRLECAAGSPPISCVTPTPSKWPAKAFR